MFLDSNPLGPHWGETPRRACKSCRRPILEHHRVEEIQFPEHASSADMSGSYHAECAKPFSSIAHAMNMLSRFNF